MRGTPRGHSKASPGLISCSKRQQWSPLALASASLGARPVLNKDRGCWGEENPTCSRSRQRLATHGVLGTGMPRASYAGASVHLALAVCGVNWGIPDGTDMALLHPRAPGTCGHMVGAGRGVGTWESKLMLPTAVHTHSHTLTLTHAALALLPAMQLHFAPGNS